MIWVCRSGKNSIYLDYYLDTSKIYLAWDGFKSDLKRYNEIDDYKFLVIQEKGEASRTSVSNWAGQLNTFCYVMKAGDYVLIPHVGSGAYTLARITGDYEYNDANDKGLWHSRKIEILKIGVPRELFSKQIQYSLGAYRTIFKVKAEEEVLNVFKEYSK